MKTSKLAFILTTCLTLPLSALESTKGHTDTRKDTLTAKKVPMDAFKKALIEAYNTNPDLAAAQAGYQAAAEAAPQAQAAFSPQVQMSAGYNRSRRFYQMNDQDNSNFAAAEIQGFPHVSPVKDLKDEYQMSSALSWGLSARMNLFQGLAGIASLSQAEYRVLAAFSQFSNEESKLLVSAITAYMDCITKQKSLESYIASEQSLSNLHEAAKTKFHVGEITKSDLLQALASYQDAKAARIKGEGDLETSRATYQKVIGSTPGNLVVPTLPEERLPKSLDEAIALTLKSNPAIIKAQFDEKAMLEGWSISAGELLPTVDGFANYNATSTTPGTTIFSSPDGRQSYPLVEGPTGGFTYGLEAKWNVFTGFSSISKLTEASQKIEQSKFLLESARRSGVELATKSWRDLISVKDEIRARKATIEAAALALEGFRQGAKLGAYSMLQVLDIESKYVQAQVNLAIAIQKEVQSTFNLLAAIGALSARELDLGEKLTA